MFRLDENSERFIQDFDQFLHHKRQETLDVSATVRDIIEDVAKNGDDALRAYTQKFDKCDPLDLAFSEAEIEQKISKIPQNERDALLLAAERIEDYHARQLPEDADYKDPSGARLGWHFSPIRNVGIYVPGGLASYPSSVLMNALPAKAAGVTNIQMCVPTPNGEVNPLVLLAAKLSGVKKIYRIGGAQAIAAMAFGTQSIPHMDMVSGPGNAYVAEAKRQVFGHIGIDMIAGPSEVLILADEHNDPNWIALDLLSQCEHDADAQAILLTHSADFAQKVEAALQENLAKLKRREIAQQSWQNHGAIIIAKSLQTAAHISNSIAPEHLQICTKDARALSHLTTEAGAIFLSAWSPEALGDYVTGPNHVLPTARSARFSSGLNVLSFMKRTTIQENTPDSLAAIGAAAVTLANSEELQAHGLSVQARLDHLKASRS